MIRPVWFALVLAGTLALDGFASAQTVVTPEQARTLAARLINVGQPRAALTVLDALVERDEKDARTLILKAHAHRVLGEYDASRQAGRAGWRHAGTDKLKFNAAIATAQALSKDDKKSRAQLWLRRAAHVAPDDQSRARAIRDHSFVRRTNPWSVRLRFGITPSDNVNNAPRDNRLVLGGLLFVDETAVPLSGVEIRSGVDLRYNFNIRSERQMFAAFSLDQENVVLTEDDENIPEGVEASDFSYTKAVATLGWDFQANAEAPHRTVTLSYGRIWSAGSHLSNEVRLGYRQAQQLDNGSRLILHGGLGYADRQDSELRSGYTGGVGATWIKPLTGGDYLSFNTHLSRSEADSAFITHTGLRLGVSYTLGKPIMGATTTFSASGLLRRYDDALPGLPARDDEGLRLSTSLLFKNFDTYGFAPKVSFTAERTNSNISRYETETLGVSIGFQSVF